MAEYGAVRTITAIETQRRDPERVNVYLDGEFAFGFSRLVAVSRGLVEGRSLSPAEVEALRAEDDV
jgi:regulatory protein